MSDYVSSHTGTEIDNGITDVGNLKTRITAVETSLGEDETKLAGIQEGAQVNTIEGVKVNGTELTPDGNKKVNVEVPDVSGFATKTEVNTGLSGKADKNGSLSQHFSAKSLAVVGRGTDNGLKLYKASGQPPYARIVTESDLSSGGIDYVLPTTGITEGSTVKLATEKDIETVEGEVSQLGQETDNKIITYIDDKWTLSRNLLRPGYFALNDGVLKYFGPYADSVRNHVVVRVNVGDTLYIEANANKKTYISFLSSYSDNGASFVAVPENFYYDINAGSSATITVPAGSVYAVFNVFILNDTNCLPSVVKVNGLDINIPADTLALISLDNSVALGTTWKAKTTINMADGKEMDYNSGYFASGFIPIPSDIMRFNPVLVKSVNRRQNNVDFGFAFYEFPTEESFIAISFTPGTSVAYQALVQLPEKANYMRVTKHSTNLPNPGIVQDKSGRNNIFGAKPVPFIDSLYPGISNSLSVGDTYTFSFGNNAEYKGVVLDCAAGDKFTVNLESIYKPWMFLDADNKVLSLGVSNTKYENYVLTAPAGAVHLLMMSHKLKVDKPSFYGEVAGASSRVWAGTQEDFRCSLQEYDPSGIFIGQDCGALKTNDTNIVNTWSERFVKEVDYNNDLEDYDNSYVSEYRQEYYTDKGISVIGSDQPLPIVISFPKTAGKNNNERLRIFKNGTEIFVTEITNEGFSGFARVWNLQPGQTYIWKYTNSTGATIRRVGAITPKGFPRWIRVMANGIADRVSNVRDLGGWPIGPDKMVKYGLILRGSDMNWGHTIDSDGIAVLKDDLHVGYDMDLRRQDEYSPFLEESPLGSDVEWGNFPVSAYDLTNFRAVNYANALTQLAENITDGVVTYIHCKAGADRTGTMAVLILGILGVSESDINKEYELTIARNRNAIATAGGIDSEVNLASLMAYIKTLQGSTIQEKIIGWALANGVTQSSIDAIKAGMIVPLNP